MKRREKKLSVMDWVLVGLLDTLAGVVAGGLMAIWQLPSAYRWRGYWAIGGEWLLVIIAIIVAVRLTHAFQMFMIFGGKKHGKMRSVSQGHYRSGGNRSGVRRKVLSWKMVRNVENCAGRKMCLTRRALQAMRESPSSLPTMRR